MLTGLFEPTTGTAFIGGKSIKHDMASIQQSMGVCPQHNGMCQLLGGLVLHRGSH